MKKKPKKKFKMRVLKPVDNSYSMRILKSGKFGKKKVIEA